MIAPADFCGSSLSLAVSHCVPSAEYDEDGLVPGADPYIAQLVAEHRHLLAEKTTTLSLPAELGSRRARVAHWPAQVAPV